MTRTLLVGAVALVVLAGTAQAAPITFFGEDLNGDSTARVAHPNADAARNAFFFNLIGVGTEIFESFGDGTPPPIAVSFPGAGTATITGGGPTQSIPVGTNGAGRYPISGDIYYEANTSSFTLTFSSPVAAFGFYGVDVGDFGGALSLTLTDSANVVSALAVGNTLGTGTDSPPDGAVLYFGFYDPLNTYKSIAFNNNNLDDFFAFDDFSIGSTQQLRPPTNEVKPVPEPASLILLGTGLAVVARRAVRRKRER